MTQKERTIQVNNWYELIEFIESVNPYKETIVWNGYVNEFQSGRLFIKSLMFTTKPVEVLKEEYGIKKQTKGIQNSVPNKKVPKK